MKKWLAILLLTILPLQFAWAAVGVYCEHEQGSAAQHFGHHSHQHLAKADKPDSHGTLGKVHKDCSSCHGAVNAIPVVIADTLVLSEKRVYIAASPPKYTSHIPDGPSRPDRQFIL